MGAKPKGFGVEEISMSSSFSADVVEQIKKFAELKDAGILTGEEVQLKKQELQAKM